MIIQVDSREKLPYDFSAFEGVQTETGTLPIGDYSLKDCGHLIACERKSLPDLINCLSHERERFSRELLKARQLDAFAVVCECTWQEIAGVTYRSGLNPAAAMASIQAFNSRWGISFLFTGNRINGEAYVYGFLKQWLKGQAARFHVIKDALKGWE